MADPLHCPSKRGEGRLRPMQPTREQAWELLNEYTKNPNLIKHALAVEAAMRAYARKYGEDEEKWALVGLLHDFDYDRWPDPADHPLVGSRSWRKRDTRKTSSTPSRLMPSI